MFGFWNLFLALRTHHWCKNLLVFLPLLAAHRFADHDVVVHSLAAFFAFCFSASAVYLMNDLLDREADQAHAIKRFRPLAAGTLPVNTAIAVAILLEIAGLALAACVNAQLLLALLAYLFLNTLYSLWLKKMLIMDAVVLTFFYTLRILAGGVATEIWISPWLIAFSNFFFLGLALLKRFCELRSAAGSISPRRGYLPDDKLPVFVFGSCCSILSVLVLVLYVNAPEAKELYRFPERLWLLSLLMLYWNCRVWVLANRGNVNEDPIVFAFQDRASLVTGAAILAVLLVSA